MPAYLLISVLPAALLIAAANDLYEFKIPNWLSITLAAAFPACALAVGAPFSLIVEGVLIGAGALAIGFGLFAFRIIGGGDAKLFAATTPWVGLSGLGVFLAYTAFCGAALVIVLIAFRKAPMLPVYARAEWVMNLYSRQRDIPYGVAICAGGLLSFSQTPLFQLVFGG